MSIGAIILIVIAAPLMWVAFVPSNLKVNTANGLYEIRQTGTIAMSLHPGETPLFKIRIVGFLVDTTQQKDKPKTAERKATRITTKGKPLSAWLYLFNGIVKSFCCRRFLCNVDFDDVVLNAQLFPLGYLVSRNDVVLNINFERKYLLDIWVKVRIYKMLWTFIRFYLTK